MTFERGGGGTLFLLLWLGLGMGIRWLYGVLANAPTDHYGELVFHGLIISVPLMFLFEWVLPGLVARIRARSKGER